MTPVGAAVRVAGVATTPDPNVPAMRGRLISMSFGETSTGD